MENLRAFRDNKLLSLQREDSPEGVDDPGQDCSLKQCCEDMIAQGRLAKASEKSVR